MPERAFSRRDTLSALLLPLADRRLIVPDVAVAELIGYLPGVPVGATAPWDLGDILWRGRQVPLVSFEALNGFVLPKGEKVRIAVLHGIDEHLPFFALLLQGVPRTFVVDTQLSYVDVGLAPLELAAVLVGKQVAQVPDLDAVAKAIVKGRFNAG